MKKRGMNARDQALRELSVNTQPHIDMERAKSETETYKSTKVSYQFLNFVHRFSMIIY